VIAIAEQSENWTLRLTHIVAQLSEALHRLTIDPYLQGFLEGTWTRAIEIADRSDPQRARRFRLLVPDLLWSIVPKVKEEDRTQLFALLPTILNTLKNGLALISWDSENSSNFLIGLLMRTPV